MGKTLQLPDVRFDVASAMSQGRREYQEDSLATDFPLGTAFGIAVLADGMGGHVAGDIASQITVTEVFSDLKLRLSDPFALRTDIPGALRSAVEGANACLGAHAVSNPKSAGMGATCVALLFDTYGMYWLSVGDSPLYLYREGKLKQLNEDHSLAPQIDYMIEHGMMDPDVGRNHPDRHCLTSVLIGGAIERIDCPDLPFPLEDGDIIILASDGLQSLDEIALCELLQGMEAAPALQIAQTLLAEVAACEDPEQDNCSFAVIRAQFDHARRRAKVRIRPVATQTQARVLNAPEAPVPAAAAAARKPAPVLAAVPRTAPQPPPRRLNLALPELNPPDAPRANGAAVSQRVTTRLLKDGYAYLTGRKASKESPQS